MHNNVLFVKANGGYFRAEASCDPNYPGIDIEFISDNETDDAFSRPRILFEKPMNSENLRVLIWDNPDNEDYEEEYVLRNI